MKNRMQVMRRLGSDCIAHLECNLHLRQGKKTIRILSGIVIENIVSLSEKLVVTVIVVGGWKIRVLCRNSKRVSFQKKAKFYTVLFKICILERNGKLWIMGILSLFEHHCCFNGKKMSAFERQASSSNEKQLCFFFLFKQLLHS